MILVQQRPEKPILNDPDLAALNGFSLPLFVVIQKLIENRQMTSQELHEAFDVVEKTFEGPKGTRDQWLYMTRILRANLLRFEGANYTDDELRSMIFGEKEFPPLEPSKVADERGEEASVNPSDREQSRESQS